MNTLCIATMMTHKRHTNNSTVSLGINIVMTFLCCLQWKRVGKGEGQHKPRWLPANLPPPPQPGPGSLSAEPATASGMLGVLEVMGLWCRSGHLNRNDDSFCHAFPVANAAEKCC